MWSIFYEVVANIVFFLGFMFLRRKEVSIGATVLLFLILIPLIAIKGTADIYTVQWAERGAAADKADVANAKWQERLKKLSPLRVCPIVPGEASPYPSCIGKT